MKILKLHVENFGKLAGVDISFTEQLNTICQPNGWGKSSLIAFIKAIFYGMPKKGNNKAYNAERSKFKPWQGGVYGGSLQFLCAKGEYEIIRTFGETPESDTFECVNLKTGLKCQDFSKKVGFELFGVGVETFEITAYFEQMNFDGSLNDEVRASLSGTNKFEHDLNHFEQAQKRIQLKMRELKSEMPKRSDIEQRLMTAKAIEKTMMEKEAEKKNISMLISTGEQDLKIEEVAVQSISQKHEFFETKQKERNHLENEIFKTQQTYADCLNQKLQREKPLQNSSCVTRPDHHSSKVSMWVCFSVFSVLTVLFAVLAGTGVVNYILGICMTVLSLLCMSVILLVGKKVHRMPEEHVDIKQAVLQNEKSQEKESILNQQISSLQQKLQSLQQQLQVLDQELAKDIAQEQKVSHGQNASQSELQLQENRQVTNAEMTQIPSREMLDKHRAKVFELQKTISLHKLQMEHLGRECEDLQERYDLLQEQIVQMQDALTTNGQKLQLLDKTLVYMQQAAENVCARFMQPMQQSFDQLYQKIAGNSKKVQLDIHFDAAEVTGVGNKEFAYLSHGYQDIISTCRRFILIETVYQKEKPVLLLDDTFVNLDAEKLAMMKNIVRDFAADYQIFYMICHPKNSI